MNDKNKWAKWFIRLGASNCEMTENIIQLRCRSYTASYPVFKIVQSTSLPSRLFHSNLFPLLWELFSHAQNYYISSIDLCLHHCLLSGTCLRSGENIVWMALSYLWNSSKRIWIQSSTQSAGVPDVLNTRLLGPVYNDDECAETNW